MVCYFGTDFAGSNAHYFLGYFPTHPSTHDHSHAHTPLHSARRVRSVVGDCHRVGTWPDPRFSLFILGYDCCTAHWHSDGCVPLESVVHIYTHEVHGQTCATCFRSCAFVAVFPSCANSKKSPCLKKFLHRKHRISASLDGTEVCEHRGSRKLGEGRGGIYETQTAKLEVDSSYCTT